MVTGPSGGRLCKMVVALSRDAHPAPRPVTSVVGQGRRFGTTRAFFSTASVSRPSARGTAGLLSATSGHPRDSLPDRQQHQTGMTFSRVVCRGQEHGPECQGWVMGWPSPRLEAPERLGCQTANGLSLPYPNSCLGTRPHQQRRGTASGRGRPCPMSPERMSAFLRLQMA
jgi:hypothetical protein